LVADLGVDVCVVEREPAKLGMLRDGKMPIYEPGLDKLVNDNVAAGRLSFTGDLQAAVAGVEAVFIAVGRDAPPRYRSRHGVSDA
jgi:UDPglucose 6-dehydrogenase